jgi:hypothetical protein
MTQGVGSSPGGRNLHSTNAITAGPRPSQISPDEANHAAARIRQTLAVKNCGLQGGDWWCASPHRDIDLGTDDATWVD